MQATLHIDIDAINASPGHGLNAYDQCAVAEASAGLYAGHLARTSPERAWLAAVTTRLGGLDNLVELWATMPAPARHLAAAMKAIMALRTITGAILDAGAAINDSIQELYDAAVDDIAVDANIAKAAWHLLMAYDVAQDAAEHIAGSSEADSILMQCSRVAADLDALMAELSTEG